MRKRAASGKSTSCWRLSFWLFSIGFRIITALFHISKQQKMNDFTKFDSDNSLSTRNTTKNNTIDFIGA